MNITTKLRYKLHLEKNEILDISLATFNDDWDLLQKFLNRRGNPPYKISGNLDMRSSKIKSFVNLILVGGWLDLYCVQIESLGSLTSVGGNLFLGYSQIKSLGNLTSVVGDLDLNNTPISKTHSKEDIRNKVKVDGEIYLYR